MRLGLLWSVAWALALGGCIVRDSGSAEDGSADDGGTSGSGTDGAAPSGCEDLFDAGPFDCSDWLQEHCDYLAEHSDLAVGWSIRLERDAGDETMPPEEAISDFERKVECITEYLDGAGVEHGPIDDAFGVTATYAQVEPLCSATMIRDCEPGPLQETCALLDEAACEENPICQSYRGTRLAAGAECVTHDVFAACITGSCDDALTVLIDPDGACWYFAMGCYIAEDGWTDGYDACPDWDVLETLPECEGG